jgi:four helix bundle protein
MTSEEFGFERLGVWRKAVGFAGVIYKMTKAFPREEMFGLTTQLRRASVSVAANIAEGTSRSSPKDQARFFEIAYGSLNEIATMLHIARGQELITKDQLVEARAEILEMCRMLSGLRQAALRTVITEAR